MNLEEKKEKLRNHLLDTGIILGEYAPGRKNRIMFDTREALLGGSLSIAAELMWDKIKKYNPTYLIGSGVGSHSLLVATQLIAEQQGVSLKVLISRGTRKTTNRLRLIEGPRPTDSDRAVYIDDIMNSGSTWKNTQKSLSDENISIDIVAACILIDFWTFRGTRRLEIKGLPIERIFYRHDFGDTRSDPKDSPLFALIAWRSLAHNQWADHYKAPPLIYDNKVYYANDRHEVYCHDIANGDILWYYAGPKPNCLKGTGCKMIVMEDVLYFTSYDGTVTAADAQTGKIKWKKYVDMFMHGSPWIDLDRRQLYIGTEGGIPNKRGDIVCLDLDTAQTKWIYPTNHVIPASPRLINNIVVCGSNDGNLYAVCADNGQLIFKLPIGVVKGRINYIDDVLIASTEDGKIYGISIDGDILWTRNCGTSCHHQYVPVHRGLGLAYIINSDGMVAAYNKTGTQIWMRNVRENGSWNITLKGNEIIVISSITSHMYLLDPLTGKKILYSKLSCVTRAPCDFNEEVIAVNTSSRGLYLFRRNND